MSRIHKKIKTEMDRLNVITGREPAYRSSFHLSLLRWAQAGLDVVFPPQPLWVVRGSSAIAALTLIDDPQCEACGFPFAYDLGEGALCGNCIAQPPDFDRARAAFIYNKQSRQPILSFKHGGQTHGLPVFTRQLARAGRDLFEGTDLLVPVPLHPRRLRTRRFNQAALLARSLSRLKNIPLDTASLQRMKATESQGGKTALGRRRNMQGAFAVREGRRDYIQDKAVILIDDVLTTGATAEACVRALKTSGAARVDVLTLARVVKDEMLADDLTPVDTIM